MSQYYENGGKFFPNHFTQRIKPPALPKETVKVKITKRKEKQAIQIDSKMPLRAISTY